MANTINEQADMMTKMVFSAWEIQNKRFSAFIEKLSDEQLNKECSPGKNTGVYLLGHLTAVHDDMFRLLGLRDKMYPEYLEMFIKSPDKSGHSFPSVAELKSSYSKVTEELNSHFSKFNTEDWLSKHTSVSEEDFVKKPTRNKLNVVISRTNHLSSHFGQMLYLDK